ncbi:MAG: prepilin-type N-terminal cleavage/methylation domain-containing protein, partial [Candidatus Magasanikbacteria bacterium]|nr:prepilin-type N-terminal cleavage/methylation domain-containing protein [Candidatus Magasanikbacteria bacterium]
MKINYLKKTKGVTLMEVIVVCGIIALLSTISIPYLRKYQPNLKLSAEAKDLAGNLRLAQQLTITEQVPYQVFFNFSGNTYSILRLIAPSTTETISTINLDSEVAFQSVTGLTDNTVQFNSYGAVSEAGDVILINT